MARILVVDDEILVREMLDFTLSGAGHEVTVAADGTEAIKAIKERPIDLVVADIVMPEKDGLELITELRKIAPELGIIAISGGSRIGNFDFLAIAKSLGARDALYKPIHNDELLESIERCLEK
ncbi:response regulator [Pelagibius sp. Alg239-R121]|uniref:response regulator n=1 Tax=Pelagibius sp. Alg239-R121 TaxID=2993448 RepID=UPI0024A61A67|nr:response regulator [Pelagibius sp. Alg239-R121]